VQKAYANLPRLQEQLEADVLGGNGPLNKQLTIATGVARTESGKPMTLVSVNSEAGVELTDRVRALAESSGAKFVEGSGHAEANIVNFARKQGLWDLAIDSSNRPCASCTTTAGNADAKLLDVSSGQYYYRGTKYGVGNIPSAPAGAPVDKAAADWVSRDPDFPWIRVGPVN
jgi:hypothetical protein